MTRPSLLENFGDMSETQLNKKMEFYCSRLAHYHYYINNTEAYNELYYTALTESMGMFTYASEPWVGESLPLKVELIQATRGWKTLTGGPCRVLSCLTRMT